MRRARMVLGAVLVLWGLAAVVPAPATADFDRQGEFSRGAYAAWPSPATRQAFSVSVRVPLGLVAPDVVFSVGRDCTGISCGQWTGYRVHAPVASVDPAGQSAQAAFVHDGCHYAVTFTGTTAAPNAWVDEYQGAPRVHAVLARRGVAVATGCAPAMQQPTDAVWLFMSTWWRTDWFLS